MYMRHLGNAPLPMTTKGSWHPTPPNPTDWQRQQQRAELKMQHTRDEQDYQCEQLKLFHHKVATLHEVHYEARVE